MTRNPRPRRAPMPPHISWSACRIGFTRFDFLRCLICDACEELNSTYRAFLDRRRAFAEEHRHEEAP